MAEIYSAGSASTVVTPTYGHRLSWGAIFAGLVTALGVMVLLSVLGLAVGLSSVDSDDQPGNFGLGAGIWGGISALIAFFVGGWMAGWARPTGHTAGGLTQGVVMWMAAIVLLVYMLAGGVGSLLRTAGNVAATGVQAAGASANAVADDPQMRQEVTAATQEVTDQVQSTIEQARQKVTPQNVERVADAAAGGAWGALISLLLTLGASAAGGYVGANADRPDARTIRRD